MTKATVIMMLSLLASGLSPEELCPFNAPSPRKERARNWSSGSVSRVVDAGADAEPWFLIDRVTVNGPPTLTGRRSTLTPALTTNSEAPINATEDHAKKTMRKTAETDGRDGVWFFIVEGENHAAGISHSANGGIAV